MVSVHLGEKSETGKLESVFTDISGDWSDDTHNLLAYYLGIVKGREDGRFDPDGQITRRPPQSHGNWRIRSFPKMGNLSLLRTAS